MGYFPDKATVHTKTVEGGLFELTKSLRYYSEEFDKWTEVPVGFQSDFASIPLIARVFINRNGKSRAPAVIHDYIYKRHTASRDVADKIFLEAMKSANVSLITRTLMYRAVRVAGWLFYEKNKDV